MSLWNLLTSLLATKANSLMQESDSVKMLCFWDAQGRYKAGGISDPLRLCSFAVLFVIWTWSMPRRQLCFFSILLVALTECIKQLFVSRRMVLLLGRERMLRGKGMLCVKEASQFFEAKLGSLRNALMAQQKLKKPEPNDGPPSNNMCIWTQYFND